MRSIIGAGGATVCALTSAADSTAHWDATYAEGDEDRSWTEPVPQASLDAIARTGAPADAAILDVGGGASRLAACLLDAGRTDVTVLDLSIRALALARGRLGDRADQVHWVVADLLAWEPDRCYDVWHDRAVLHFFTSDDERARYAAVLRAALAPGGHAVIATFAPDGPERCSGLPVRRSSAAETLTLLGDGFAAVHTEVRVHRTPSGGRQPFAWLVARRDA